MVAIRDWFLSLGWSEPWAAASAILVALVAAALLAEAFRLVAPPVLSKLLRTKEGWLAAFQRRRVFRALAWVLVLLGAESLVTPVLEKWPKRLARAETALDAALVIAVTFAVVKAISAAVDTLEVQEGKEQRLPLRALGQALQLALWTYASVIFLSVLTHRDVTTLVTGLTALGAVLVYVFRDPILGWTAGIQIAANDLARVGDWITVPKHGADGPVHEIALTAIKVRNWDNTISNIPTYSLVSEGFCNWRGMYESGGRRIKRSVAIDANRVRFCDQALLERLKAKGLLRAELPSSDSKLTNLNCFRSWLEAWLKEHPEVHEGMTTMVRELAPEGRGIPVEIYAFSKDTGWVAYEHLQADIYDRVLSVLAEFDLRVFQEPTGDDLRELAHEQSTPAATA
jgi:miniconductance mechanosensitive channel